MKYTPKFAKRPKKKRTAKVTTKEAEIQAMAENLLNIYGIAFLRLSDTLMRGLFANPAVPLYIKKIVSDELKGFPDLCLFDPDTKRYKAIELKTETGRLSHAQRDWQRKLDTRVCHGFDAVKEEIEAFRNGN